MTSSMHLQPVDGAAQQVGAEAIASGHRDKGPMPLTLGIWPNPADEQVGTRPVRDSYAAVRPHSGSEGGRIHSMSGDDDHRAADGCGADHERLSAVKAVHDPDDLVHVNQNIASAERRRAR